MNDELIGIVSGLLTSSALVPQVVKIIRTKKADDLSYFMIATLIVGQSCWIWYGIIKSEMPIILTNSFSLIVNFVTLFLTIRFRKKQTDSEAVTSPA